MMQRRTALQLLGSTLGSACLPWQAVAASQSATWKTAVGLNGFMSSAQDYQQTFPLWEILDFASQTGFDGIELVSDWPMGGYPKAADAGRIGALKRLYDGFHLKVFSIQLGAGGAFDPDATVRRRWIEEFRDRATFAKRVGCECVGLWPGGSLRGQTIDAAIDRLAESFQEVGEIAKELGLLAAFEIEPPFVFNCEEHLTRILAKVNHPNLKTIYDPSHFDLMSGSVGKSHEMLQRIGVDNIGYVHLTDTDGTQRGGTSKHLPCGDGHVDIAASLAILLAGDFRGWLMIDAWKIPDPYDACRKGKQAIDRALAKS